jgi:peroxiredoxin
MKTWSAAMLMVLPLLGVSVLFTNASPSLTLRVGDKAPDFVLRATDGKQTRLADYLGKSPIVLAFSPGPEGTAYELSLERLRANSEVKVFEIKTSYAALTPAPLTDSNSMVSRSYGIYSSQFVQSTRVTFVINKESRIDHIEWGADALSNFGSADACARLAGRR